MKIKKTPPKKLINPPIKIQQLVDLLTTCQEEDIAKVIEENSPWRNQKSDLYHWIQVLNRFDSILETYIQQYDLKHIQAINFTEDSKKKLLSILTFTRYLWENCINRNIYNSYEHLNLLLNTNDIDVLEALLRLMLKFAQRLGNTKSQKTNFYLANEKIYTMFHTWISKDFGLDINQLLKPDTVIHDYCCTLVYQFYRCGKQNQKSENSKLPKQTSTNLKRTTTDGLVTITLNKAQLQEKNTQEIFNELVTNYDIPQEHKFPLYYRIRFLKSINDYELRLKFITIRLFALAIYVQMIEEETAQTKIFLYEPDLIQNLSEILQIDDPKTYGIQTAIISVLDGIIRFKSKTNVVLAAINSSTNYGILAYVFRKVIKNLDMDEMELPQEYIDIFFTLVSYIISLQSNINTLAIQVTINLLTSVLENKRIEKYKNLTKCIILMDNFLLIKTQAFPVFIESNGLEKVIDRIKYEVQNGVKLIENSLPDQNMQDVNTGLDIVLSDEKEQIIPHENMVLLRAILKLILHLMQTSGSADRMRNLIDSSLPNSLYNIFKYYKSFGILVYGITIEIMSTFIHNEPTCLNILQEAKLPQIFLETVKAGVPVSSEAVSEMPTAFGALCLNSNGLNYFNEVKPLDKYFEMFSSEEHIRIFTGNYNALTIGNGIDELIRHHPSLKNDIINSIVKMINKLMDENGKNPLKVKTGIFLVGANDEKDITMDDSENTKQESEYNYPVFLQQLSICFKFLEGLFQNSSHHKEFIENGGFEAIMKIYTLPYLPYNFIASPANFYCTKTVRMIVEADSEKIMKIINEKLESLFEELYSKIESIPDFTFTKYTDMKDDEKTINEGNEIFRLMISILALTELLNDLFSSSMFRVLSQLSLIKITFLDTIEKGKKLIENIGKLINICLCEYVKMRNENPLSWDEYIEKNKQNLGKRLIKSDISNLMLNTLTSPNLENDTKFETEINVNDSIFKNYKYLQFILKRYLICATTLHESLSKFLMTRRVGVTDEETKKAKYQIIKSIGNNLKNGIEHVYTQKNKSKIQYIECLNMYLSVVSHTMLNERNPNLLQTVFIMSLNDKSNFSILEKIFFDLWDESKIFNSKTDEKKENKEDELEKKINKGINSILNIFLYLSSFDALQSTNQLTSIQQYEEFKINDYVVITRTLVLSIILKIWKDENLKKCPSNFMKEIITIIHSILKANGENSIKVNWNKPPSVLFQKLNVTANPEKVAILMDMGFPRKACETALVKCGNQVSRATDYILNHPELMESNQEDEANTSNAQSSNNNATTSENHENPENNVSVTAQESTLPNENSSNGNNNNENTGNSNNNNNGENNSNENNIEDSSNNNNNSGNNNSDTNNNNNNNTENRGEGNENQMQVQTTTDTSQNNNDMVLEELEPINDVSMAENQSSQTNENVDLEVDLIDDTFSRAFEMSFEAMPELYTLTNSLKGKTTNINEKQEKNDEEIIEYKKKLTEMRKTLENEVKEWLFEIMEYSEDSVDQIKNLIILLNKESSQIKEILNKIVNDIETYHKNNELYTMGERTRYRLIIKFLIDNNFKVCCAEVIKDLVNESIDMFINVITENNLEWSMPNLLLIDLYILFCKTNLIESDENIEIENTKEENKLNSLKISLETRKKLIEKIVQFMNLKNLKGEIIHCFYRLIIELIDDYEVALYFMEINGLKALFNSKTANEGFQGQNNLVIIMLRRLVEEPTILKEIMECEIYLHLNRNRQQSCELKYYSQKLFPYVVEHNPEIFIEATKSMCKLKSPEQEYYIGMKSKYQKEKTKSNTSEQIDEEDNLNETNETKDEDKLIKEEEKKSDDDIMQITTSPETMEKLIKATEPIITFLVEEFLVNRNLNSPSSSMSLDSKLSLDHQKLIDEKNNSSTTKVDSTSTEKEEIKDISKSIEKITKERNMIFYQHAFLIQCITELVSSYYTCKVNLLNCCKNHKKLVKSQNSFIYYIINEYVFSEITTQSSTSNNDNQNSETNKNKYKSIESELIIKLIFNMLTSESYEYEKYQENDLLSIRKSVIEIIAKCLSDSLNKSEIIEQKYKYYCGLAKLCLKLINTNKQYNSKKLDEFSISIAKLMLDNNYIILLTNIISDIDVNHPQSSSVIYNVMKPLDLLISTAIEVNKNSNSSGAVQSQEIVTNLPIINIESQIPNEEENEISDMYRTSALGIFSGENENEEDENEDEEDDGEEEEEEYEEDEYTDSEEDLSDDSEISDIEDEEESEEIDNPDVEMEIVMRPYDDENEDDEEEEANENQIGESEQNDDILLVDDNNNQMRWETPYSINEDNMRIDNIIQDNNIMNENNEIMDNGIEIIDDEDEDEDDEDDIEDEDDNEDEDENEEDEEDIIFEGDNIDSYENEDEENFEYYDRRMPWVNMIQDDRIGSLTRAQENWINGRNGVMEIQLGPQGIEFRLPNSNSRNLNNLIRTVDRSIAPQINSSEISVHPLLSRNSGTGNTNNENRDISLNPIANQTYQLMERIIQELNPSMLNAIRNTSGMVANSTLRFSNDSQILLMNDSADDFKILNTQKRWQQEAQFLNINPNRKHNKYIQKCILDDLLPKAIEEDKKRKEEEERKKKIIEEKKRKQIEEQMKIEEEKRKKEAEAAEARRKSIEEQNNSENQQNNDAEMVDANEGVDLEPRVTVMVNGQEVDITNTGIDPTFLEALPDDLRQEIIEQHVSETRRNQASVATLSSNDEISNDFLFALPDEIREEILQHDRMERERQQNSHSNRSQTVHVNDPSQYIIMNDQFIYYDNDNENGQMESEFTGRQSSTRGTASHTTKKKIVKEKREIAQLLEKPALASLIRLLYIPKGAVTVESIQQLLTNLSKNSKSRSELISILLCILIDGSCDLADVDKNFSQMSLRSKGKTSTKKSVITSNTITNIHSSNDYIPNLVAHRSLETLSYLVLHNDQIIQYFLTENENFNVNLTRRSSIKKSKGKEKTTTSKYPVVVLLSLLDRPTFLSNPSLMEKLTSLLSQVLRPLTHAQLYEKTELKNGQQQASTTSSTNVENANINSNSNANNTNTETTNIQTSITDTVESNTNEANNEINVPSENEIANNNTNSTVKSNISNNNSKTQKSPSIQIPLHYCNSIVNVFIASECTSKTFQNTLIILQSITSIKEYYVTIKHQLIHAVQKIIDSIYSELINLKQILIKPNVEIQKLTFHNLTSASSKQAQILRVLKAIDFLEAKRMSKIEKKNESENEKNDTNVRDSEMSISEAGISNDTANKKEETVNSKHLNKVNENELLQIYNQLSVKSLWNNLGEILTLINDNPDIIHVATILLPLIEAFMVISKPYVLASPEKHQSSAQLLSNNENETINQTNEEIFYSMTNKHRKILNTMVRNNPSLMKNSFALLVSNSKILDFDNKRTYFNQQLHKRTTREHYGTLQITVRRQYVFEDSFHKLQGKTGNEIKYSKLNVRFQEEEGVDVGGVTREWFSALARQMFNPDYALFKPSAVDKVTYQPNRNSWINPDHLSFFKFVGRIIGKAIYDGRALDCYFTRSFYKHILKIDVDYKDIEALDPEYFKSLEWILHNDITDVLELTFALEIDEFGKKRIVDLKPNGRNISVVESNKVEYVKLVTEQRLTIAIKQQIEAFLNGFHDIIPHSLISIFNEQELELLISGLPDIDIDDWKNNTTYENYNSSSPQVQWFWRAVRSFTQEERAKLIQFTTGTSKVPLEGFSNLQGVNGIQKFQIHKDFGSIDRLPSAHTCFNQLDIPVYESYEHLRKALLLAINECSVGFGFA